MAVTVKKKFDGKKVADRIERALRAVATPARAAQEKKYLKSDLEHAGATVPQTREIVRAEVMFLKALTREEILEVVEALWAKPIHERRAAAVMILETFQKRLEAEDLALVERLLRESKTWALVDELSARIAGTLVTLNPDLVRELDRWAKDEDFWIRRSAMLALLIPLRKGKGDFARFARYADAMLEEKEFFIRKAIGWILRERSKVQPEEVYEWLLPRAARASGLTVREAVKYLPASKRKAILAAYGAKK